MLQRAGYQSRAPTGERLKIKVSTSLTDFRSFTIATEAGPEVDAHQESDADPKADTNSEYYDNYRWVIKLPSKMKKWMTLRRIPSHNIYEGEIYDLPDDKENGQKDS